MLSYLSFLCVFFPIDLSPNILVELVIRVRSTRLKLMVADAIFRNLCCRNGCTMGDEPLSLKKMVRFLFPCFPVLYSLFPLADFVISTSGAFVIIFHFYLKLWNFFLDSHWFLECLI